MGENKIMASEKLELGITLENGQFKIASGEAEQKIKSMAGTTSGSFSKIATYAKMFIGAVVIKELLGLGKTAVDAGSRLEESSSKFKTSFSGNMEKASAGLNDLTNNFAMSKREAMDYMSSLQTMLVPMGVIPEKATEMSRGMTKLAADLASFSNIPIEQALTAIRGGLAGESEPLRRVGVYIRQTAVESYALSEGIVKSGKELTGTKFITAAYGKILKDTSIQQGDMARTADGYANTMRRLNATMEDFSAAGGAKMQTGATNISRALAIVMREGSPLRKMWEDIAETAGFALTNL